MKYKTLPRVLFVVGLLLLAPIPLVPKKAQAQLSLIRDITFPVIGNVTYYDDFGAPRSGGRTHEGNDLMGKKMMPLVAAVDGTIRSVAYPQAEWGYSVYLQDKDGYRYNYYHINNDTPGTDNGQGDGFFAYAPDVVPGNPVVKGQLIGYMGDSGNAETTSPHLHFEIRTPDGQPFSPYLSLKQAPHLLAPVTTYPALPGEILPFENFSGGVHIASGNLDTDSETEVVAGAGPTGGPLVKVFDKNGTLLSAFYAYSETFRGGVDVAVGDTDGNGSLEIITSPGSGGGPHIKVFTAQGVLVSEFLAYDAKFRGGVNVSTVDADGDGKAEIITAPGAGGGPHVKVFDSKGLLKKEFFAYDGKFYGGVDVVGVAKTSTYPASIVTAPGAGGGPHIKIFDASLGMLTKEFFAYDGMLNLGVRISAGVAPTSSLPRIVTIPATGGGPHLKSFGLDGVAVISDFAGFEEWWRGGYDIATTGADIILASGAGRRGSIRVYNPATTRPPRWWNDPHPRPLN